MSWGKYSKKTKGGSGPYVKLGSGDSITFVVVGKPHETHKLFPEGGGKPQDVKPGTPGADFKIILHVFDTAEKTSKILQLTRTTFTRLDERIGEFGVDHTFRIKRTGTTMTDTRYEVDHIGETPSTVLSMARAEDPIDLERVGGIPISIDEESAPTPKAASTKGKPTPVAEPTDEEIPF